MRFKTRLLRPLVYKQPAVDGGGGSDAYSIARGPSGTDKYLDPNAGSDGTGTEASPWKTLSEAKLQSLSGTVWLWIKNGTVNAVEARGLPSGDSSNRITVSAYPGHTPTINFAVGGAYFGGGDYWDWRGLSITCEDDGFSLPGDNPSSGAAIPVNYWRFIDCTGTKGTTGTTDNSGVIKLGFGNVEHIEIIRCSFTGSESASNNRSGIWADRTQYLKIIGCKLDGFNCPIYYKHNHQQASSATTDIQIKNCIIRNSGRSMLMCVAYAVLTNCAFDSCDVNFADDGGDPAGDKNTITNCTFMNSSRLNFGIPQFPATTDLFLGCYQNVVRNCLFAGSSYLWDNRYGESSNFDNQTDTDYNCFASGANVYGRNGSESYSLASYKAAFTDQEVHSTSGTIALVGGSTPGATPTNWALVGGSAGLGAGEGGVDCGVNATKLLTVN